MYRQCLYVFCSKTNCSAMLPCHIISYNLKLKSGYWVCVTKKKGSCEIFKKKKGSCFVTLAFNHAHCMAHLCITSLSCPPFTPLPT